MVKKTQLVVLIFLFAITLAYGSFWLSSASAFKTHVTDVLLKGGNQVKISSKASKVYGFPFKMKMDLTEVKVEPQFVAQKKIEFDLGRVDVELDIINFQKTLTFNKIININIEEVAQKTHKQIHFHDNPVIQIKFDKADMTRKMIFFNGDFSKTITNIDYHDQGYDFKSLKDNEVLLGSRANSINYQNLKDNKSLLKFVIQATDKSANNSLGEVVLSGDVEIQQGKEEFTLLFNKLDTSTDQFSNSFKGRLAVISGKLSYEVSVKIDNLTKFIRCFSLVSSEINENILQKILLKLSGNQDKENVENIEFIVKKNPIGEVMIGNMSAGQLILAIKSYQP